MTTAEREKEGCVLQKQKIKKINVLLSSAMLNKKHVVCLTLKNPLVPA